MTDAMRAETVSIQGDGGDQLEAYLARPLGEGPFGGVVVIHHLPGYDEATKEITRRFAAHRYLAICPNLYSREAPGASPDDAAATVRA
ncbi:MAG TPA: dienelactone hydrolase family protein, partial [Acidimicrobiales bacterium]|nr:dienelactone hydrolase family protein [Acidimicrobiales bacterium]